MAPRPAIAAVHPAPWRPEGQPLARGTRAGTREGPTGHTIHPNHEGPPITTTTTTSRPRPVESAKEIGRTAKVATRTARRAARAQTEPKGEALRRGRGALIVAVLAFLGFVGIFAIVRANRSMELDLGISMRLQKQRHPWLARTMEVVSWPGFPPQSRAIPSFTSIALWILGFPLEALFLLGAWTTGLVSEGFKAIMKRPRPEHVDLRVAVGPLGGSSFPSGHVITYVGFYGFLAYLAHTLIKPLRPRRGLTAIFAGLVAMIGPSRIYQGHHWPTDVAASYLLGTSYLIALTSVYRRFKARTTPPPV